jgi:formyl-CoA transferase
VNPRLVYAAIRGFGDPRTGTSPYVDWPAYDVVAQAMGGIISITGPKGEPTKVGPGLGDSLPAALTAFGILAAVYRANKTGEGQFIDVAMYDAMLRSASASSSVFVHGVVPTGGQCPPALVSIRPLPGQGWSGCNRLSARSLLGASHRCHGAPRAWHGRSLSNEPRTGEAQRRSGGVRVRLDARPDPGRTLGQARRRVPFGPVNDAADIFADQHPRARKMLVEVEQPGVEVPMTIAGTPIKTDGAGASRRSPLLGEHTDAILTGPATRLPPSNPASQGAIS